MCWYLWQFAKTASDRTFYFAPFGSASYYTSQRCCEECGGAFNWAQICSFQAEPLTERQLAAAFRSTAELKKRAIDYERRWSSAIRCLKLADSCFGWEVQIPISEATYPPQYHRCSGLVWRAPAEYWKIVQYCLSEATPCLICFIPLALNCCDLTFSCEA